MDNLHAHGEFQKVDILRAGLFDPVNEVRIVPKRLTYLL